MASILLGLVMGLSLLVYSALPAVFQGLGLHGEAAATSPYKIHGRKALIITTSEARLKPTDQVTGVWASELTTPFYIFQDAGLQVELASIRGGKIPLEPGSADWPLASAYDQRMNSDPHLRHLLQHALPLAEIKVSDYDLIFIAGGWGAAYDLGQSELLGQKVSEAFAQKIIQGSVCHGPLGWLKAHKPNGEPLLKGTRVTGVSNRQLEELGITFTPFHPERELRAAGALYEAEHAVYDLLASHVVVDGLLVSGQNQNSAAATAQAMLQLLQAMDKLQQL